MDFNQIEDRRKYTPQALIIFARIMNAWHVSPKDRQKLLGNVPNFSFENFNEENTKLIEPLSENQIQIILELEAVAKYLQILLPRPNADDWVNKPNRASLFLGKTALEYMCINGKSGIQKVQQYLAAQVYG